MVLDTYDDQQDSGDGLAPGRPFIGVLFECCGVYARVYRQHDQKYYEGRCPKCLRLLRVRVGPDGVAARLFRAS